MKDSRASRAGRERKAFLSPDAEKLVAAALGLANSGSRVEDRFWEDQLHTRVDRLLDSGHAQTIEQALERLQQTDQEAYGALIEAVEEGAEALEIEHEGETWQVLMISAPLVSWTRFKIPTPALAAPTSKALRAVLAEHVLAEGVKLAFVPQLYSIDQMPADFNEVRRFVRRLGQGAVTQANLKFDHKNLPESADMLADVRFLVAAIAAPKGAPVFRWQQLESKAHASRVSCLEAWVSHARPYLETLLAGCGFECLLPDAYHINLREADRRVRPFAIRAGVNYLTHSYGREPGQIKAVIGGFGLERVEEYRISLCLDAEGEQVVQGIVWPILGPEMHAETLDSSAAEPSQLQVIRELLSESGVTDIRHWDDLNDPEFCEDCGAPLFPNAKGDIVHTEIPEEMSEPGTQHFH